MTPSSTLVLGTAFGYGIKEIWVFVESLRRFYDGDAALLVNSRSPQELFDYLRRHGIRPIYFDCPFWMVPHVQLGRYVRYGEFLRECPGKYSQLLLSDVSDVAFQAHPFAGLPSGELLFFLEDWRLTIDRCPTNFSWVQDIYGADGLTRLWNKRLSCSGTTVGTQAAILHYIDLLLSHAPRKLMEKLVGQRGHDQGIHNYLLHTGALPSVAMVENGEFVWTLYHVPDREIAATDNGFAVATTGKMPAILHQYNFKPAIQAFMARTYPRDFSLGP
jgi:hypothetical protein